MVSTGIKVNIPKGYYIDIRPRSGLYSKNDIMIANTPGTIDSGYLNVIYIAIRNLSHEKEFVIEKGAKIAQFKLEKLVQYDLEQISQDQFNRIETDRGLGGFGSSDRGIKNVIK